MKYSQQQDINAIVLSISTGRPKREYLIKRLVKKYNFSTSTLLIIKAFKILDKKSKNEI